MNHKNGWRWEDKIVITPSRGTTSKRITSGGAYLCGLGPEQHSSEETSQQWRAVGDMVSNLTHPEIEPRTFRADSGVFYYY